jgi:hypothetical protein
MVSGFEAVATRAVRNARPGEMMTCMSGMPPEVFVNE